MRKHRVLTAVVGLALSVAEGGSVRAQQTADGGVPTHLVVTVEPRKGTSEPVVNREDVMVYQGHNRDKVTDWLPAQADHAALELFILLDDGAGLSLGSQLEEIRNFMDAQPDSTKIGVAYMQNGTARIAQNLTTDHAAAAKSLRLPLGEEGVNASPYFVLSDLAKRWPDTTARRAVLMVSDGIDRYYGSGDLQDPYVDAAVDDALRAGIMVSAIYNPDTGHFGHSYWQTHWGQIYLSEVADETGGEAYDIGYTGPAVSFGPYLNDFSNRLSHQFLLTFLAKPEKKAGWQKIRVTTEVHNVDLVSAHKVYVSAGAN
jgi:hypothetical protein